MALHLKLCKKCVKNNRRLSGCSVYIPRRDYAPARANNDKIKAMRAANMSAREIAIEVGMCQRQVYRILKEAA